MKEWVCCNCGQKFKRYKSQVRNPNMVFCGKKCKYIFDRGYFKGKNNPNYGNRWSQEKRNELSKRSKEFFKDPDNREKVAANRGKKFSKETKEKMSRSKRGIPKKTKMTEETKRKIGIKSAEKFTEDFLKKQRVLMEERGYWIPLNQKSNYEIYCIESNWIEGMLDKIKTNEQIHLLREIELKSLNNPNGLVRDHKYGRRNGFFNKVFPEILRHPCNCQLITNQENLKKSWKNNDSVIKLHELFDEIENYNGNWKEHKICLQKIKEYKNGKRWKNKWREK